MLVIFPSQGSSKPKEETGCRDTYEPVRWPWHRRGPGWHGRRRRRGGTGPGGDRLVAPRHQRSGQDAAPDHRRRVHGDAPGRQDQRHGAGEEALKSALAVEMQAGSAPDIFHSWGGGILAEQVDAGMVQSLEGQLDDSMFLNEGAMSIWQVGGEQYGVPYTPSASSCSSTTRTSSHRRASTSRPPPGTSSWRTCRRSRTPACTAIAVAGQDKVAGHVLLGVPRAAHGRPGGLRGGHRHGKSNSRFSSRRQPGSARLVADTFVQRLHANSLSRETPRRS